MKERRELKLSMWMIANRLSSLDLDLDIREEAGPVLKSARRVYATNCVHVYQSGKDVICNGEGDCIRIKDTRITEAFEIVQCVFDFYEDWMSDIMDLIKAKNYRELVNSCWSVFHNPMVLFDGNCRVLGLSEQYAADDLDEEWRYLSTYGYTSVKAIDCMKYNGQNKDFTKMGMQRFEFDEGLMYPGITYSLYFQDVLCGRINLLEKERRLNKGDYQILELLADLLKTGMMEHEAGYLVSMNENLFYSLLDGGKVDEGQMKIQLDYHHWDPLDVFQLYLIEMGEEQKDKMAILAHTILQQLPSCCIIQRFPEIVVICDVTKYNGKDAKQTLRLLAGESGVHVSCGIQSKGIYNVHYLLNQARAAITYGRMQNPDEVFYPFYRHAMDYIIESSSLEDSVMACHADVRELWRRKQQGDDMFETLKCYLNNERSLVNTAQAMYLHRNTLVYRVRKLTEFLNDELNDVYSRDYMKLSIRTLELYEWKMKRRYDGKNIETGRSKDGGYMGAGGSVSLC